ncbi:response regulator [Paenibacillus oceani]|uniref:Response regulator n=1 Tax=Paenibacillus oceani TaxID=2772510 RepID=A0A927CFV7_9BACL|nr:response regulator [Paenibacillus oceani]MBD2866202.1 response regulator [Paenibacillus oceani]
MKVLIVDDEKHVRDAIKLLVDWNDYGIDTVLEASDGVSAAALIEAEKPQIVYTDMMMPNMDGISLLRWIQDNAPDCRTIVISGHDDFEFMRGAVKYGGMDYLLKPIDAEQLLEITEKAVRSWNEAERARLNLQLSSIRMNSLLPVYADKLFSSLIGETTSYYAEKAWFEQEYPELREGTPCRVAAIAFDTLHGKLRDKFAAQTELLQFSLANIGNELMNEQPRQGFAFRYWSSRHPVVLVHWGSPERTPRLLESINDGIYRAFGARVEFGLGGSLPFPSALKESFAQAESALRHRNLLNRTGWIHADDPKEKHRPAEIHFSDFEDLMRVAIRSASQEKIREAVQAWITEVSSRSVVTLDHLELWRHEFHVLKSRWVKELFPADDTDTRFPVESAELPVPLNEQGLLSLEKWGGELAASLIRLSEFLRHAAHQENNLVYEIARYVQQRIDRDISVQDIASHFYLSREYVSRRFKQEFGETISDYILRHRMEQAKTLLLHPDLKIVQIARMTGYEDEKYFSKVFKKAFGVTPMEYRKKQSGEA